MPDISLPKRYHAYLASLNEAGVRYLVIGDLACQAHGMRRPPDSLEIWVDPASQEHGFSPALGKALGKFYGKLRPETGQVNHLLDNIHVYYEMPDNRLSFEEAYEARKESEYFNERLPAASGEHLVTLAMAEAKTREEQDAVLEFREELAEAQARLERERTRERGPHEPER